MRTTYTNLKAMSATAIVSSEGYSDSTKPRRASFSAVRAQVGDWKLAVRETSEGTGEGAKRGVEVAYDGATARSLRHKDKAVAQRTLVKVPDVRSFFVQQDAGQFVPWEVIDLAELAAPGGVRGLAPVTIDGAPCHVIELVQTAPANPAGANPAEKDDGRPRELVVLALEQQSSLVRRIDRIQEAPGGKRFTRSLVLEGLKVNDSASPMDFSPAAPDGYAVRTRGGSSSGKGSESKGGGKLGEGTKSADKPADKPGEKAVDAGQARTDRPHGITWPHDADTLPAGTSLPNFSLKNAKGETITNADYKGKVMIVDVWGTWCPPCRAAMPALQSLHNRFKGKPVAVVGFNYERSPNADPIQFKKQNGYTYDMLLEAGSVLDSFRVESFPTFYVVDAQGKVVWGGTGLMPPPGVNRPTPRQTIEYLEQTLRTLVEGELAKLEAPKPEATKPETSKPAPSKPD
jgi:thiol-disulfide isomerase/thioredoxin